VLLRCAMKLANVSNQDNIVPKQSEIGAHRKGAPKSAFSVCVESPGHRRVLGRATGWPQLGALQHDDLCLRLGLSLRDAQFVRRSPLQTWGISTDRQSVRGLIHCRAFASCSIAGPMSARRKRGRYEGELYFAGLAADLGWLAERSNLREHKNFWMGI
jgi:hypothetical protein